MIMQAYDFLYLHEHYGCNMQFGGDDQWSNMLAGTDLIRRKASYALFSGIGDDSNMPTSEFSEHDIPEEGILLTELLVSCKLCASKSEARRLIVQGGITVDDKKMDSVETTFSKEELKKGLKIRKGKKSFRKAVLLP